MYYDSWFSRLEMASTLPAAALHKATHYGQSPY